MDNDDDSDDYKWVWPHPGDFGVILLAAVFLAGMIGAVIFIFSSPEPVADLFGHKPAAQQNQNNEVTIPLQKPQNH